MYAGGDYNGGAAAFMGGGFMSSQSQAPDPIFSPSKNRETRCLFPLTVKQICNLASNDESNFVIDGVEVNNVNIVGRVCQKEDKVSESTFLVDDGTGVIECTKWVQERVDPDEISEISIGSYVRVHGQLRGLQGRRFLNVFSINANEDGVSRDVIARQFQLSPSVLMAEIQLLVDNGFIYSTIDDDHYKSTVNA